MCPSNSMTRPASLAAASIITETKVGRGGFMHGILTGVYATDSGKIRHML